MKARPIRIALGIILVAIPLGLVSYVIAGPYLTMRRFGEALAARDARVIAECVNFAKLRANIKEDINHKLTAQSAVASNPILALAAGLAQNVVDPLVDSWVTPAGLEKLLAGERLLSTLGNAKETTTEERAVTVPKALANADYSFRSPSEFAVIVSPQTNIRVEITLEREGLSWRIARVRAPE